MVTNDTRRLDLIRESLKEQPLKYRTSVHIVDQAGNILGRAEYMQDRVKRDVRKSTIWHDFLEFPAKQLPGASAIGIGIYLSLDRLLMTDRAPTDWNKCRLLIKLSDMSYIPPPGVSQI